MHRERSGQDRPPDGLILVAEGKATHYRPGRMDQAIRNRLRWRQLDLSRPHLGYVALKDRCHIDARVWLELPGGIFDGGGLVADCGKRNHHAHLRKIGFAVDLSYELTQRDQAVGRPLYGVEVWLETKGSPSNEVKGQKAPGPLPHPSPPPQRSRQKESHVIIACACATGAGEGDAPRNTRHAPRNPSHIAHRTE